MSLNLDLSNRLKLALNWYIKLILRLFSNGLINLHLNRFLFNGVKFINNAIRYT
jgi:hypothetical protein